MRAFSGGTDAHCDLPPSAPPASFLLPGYHQGASMPFPGICFRLTLFVVLLLGVPRMWAQGPPYQTDDPVPVDLHHYEFYIFGGVDGTPAEID